MTCYITHATTVDKTALRERERTCLRNHLPAERMAAKRLRNCPEQKIRREFNKYKEKKTCWKKLRRKKKEWSRASTRFTLAYIWSRDTRRAKCCTHDHSSRHLLLTRTKSANASAITQGRMNFICIPFSSCSSSSYSFATQGPL